MSDIVLGQLIKDLSTPKKDAVHVAIARFYADATLLPGSRVRILYSGSSFVRPAMVGEDYHGVVDPFLIDPVLPSQQCWIFLKPGSVTNLRHNWSHDFVDDQDDVEVYDYNDECRGCG